MFLCLENDDELFAKLCESLEHRDLAGDPRFDSKEKRKENGSELVAALDAILVERTAAEWMKRWQPLGIAASPIQNLEDVSRDPQAWDNDYFVKTHCDEVNREVSVRGLPIALSKTPGSVETLGPELGQDTELILADTLGYS